MLYFDEPVGSELEDYSSLFATIRTVRTIRYSGFSDTWREAATAVRTLAETLLSSTVKASLFVK